MSTDKLQVFKNLPFLVAVINCTKQSDALIDEIVSMVLDKIEVDYNSTYDYVVDWLTEHCPLGAGETVESVVSEILADVFRLDVWQGHH